MVTDSLLQAQPPQKVPTESQFGLVTVFYVMSLYTVGLTLGTWTLIPSTIILALWVMGRIDGCGPFVFVGVFALILMLIGTLLHIVPQIRHTGRWSDCLNNVRQLTIAIVNFESAHQKYPPAYEVDDNGQPKHSWRVLILPELGYQNLFAAYNFDEPWDSSNNSKMLDQMPREFQCPCRPHAHLTHYKLVVDAGTPFEEGRTVNYNDITDGTSNTICIVEDAAHPVPWTKPEGITVAEAIAAIAPEDSNDVAHIAHGTFTTHFNSSSYSRMDGSTHLFGPTTKTHTIKTLCICDDGGIFSYDKLGESISVTHWDKYFVLVVYIGLSILPVFFRTQRKIANV